MIRSKRVASFAARPAKKPTVGFFDGARFVVLTSEKVKLRSSAVKQSRRGFCVSNAFLHLTQPLCITSKNNPYAVSFPIPNTGIFISARITCKSASDQQT